MNIIRLLPEQLANQIAAGEVIERPASVVKELVENSIDAQATRITVEIQAGGRSLIRVIDDGIGMSRDDALLCLERHATSKIKSADDLNRILTMGFRGEALPSIASVSRFILVTRERNEESIDATKIIVDGGKLINVTSAGAAPGTMVEVRNLFFNLPARRKFMRSPETERAHIQHYLGLVAVAYPEIGLTYIQENKCYWHLPPVTKGKETRPDLDAVYERIKKTQGINEHILPVDYQAKVQAQGTPPWLISIKGWIGSPGVSRATREDMHIFVNRRPVENRGISYAIIEGYHTALMKGRFPIGWLFIEIDPRAVDVNIHPSKREVKFHAEFEVRNIVTQAIRNAISKQTSVLIVTKDHQESQQEQPTTTPCINHMESCLPTQQLLPVQTADSLNFHQTQDQVQPVQPEKTIQAPSEYQQKPLSSPEQKNESDSRINEKSIFQVDLNFLAVLGNLYVLFESDHGLVLMDQHAAHERVLFEKMLSCLDQNAVPSQRLLLPETIELSPKDAFFLSEYLEVFNKLGIGISKFGDRTYIIDSVPFFFKKQSARSFLLDVIDTIKASGPQINKLRLGENEIAKAVCKNAVKAHDPLKKEEILVLLDELKKCKMPFTCPHGRPTLVEISFRELGRKFGRIV